MKRLLIWLLFAGGLLIAGCRAPLALVADLPPTSSTVTVSTTISQPFYSAADGIDGITIGLNIPTSFTPGTQPALTNGARVEVSYAPELDPRYPDRDFYAWPSSEGWLGELVDGRVVGQSFLSRYPGLNGITVRVSTYGADFAPGTGTLRNDGPVTVREAPIAGNEITVLPGGVQVAVDGAREGWAHVRLPDGRSGYIDEARFASLPPATRHNTGVLILQLYDDQTGALLREAQLNVADVHDESHVTFSFNPLPDSYQRLYRFTITARGSTPGHAVTLRYAPADVYPEGMRYEGDTPAGGDLIFRPTFAPTVLTSGALDDGRWSGLTNTIELHLPPAHPTRDCYLRLTIRAGTRPLFVRWSWTRPPGGLPFESADNPGAPAGGLVFNAHYTDTVPLGSILHGMASTYVRRVLGDPVLIALEALLVVGALGWWAVTHRRDVFAWWEARRGR